MRPIKGVSTELFGLKPNSIINRQVVTVVTSIDWLNNHLKSIQISNNQQIRDRFLVDLLKTVYPKLKGVMRTSLNI